MILKMNLNKESYYMLFDVVVLKPFENYTLYQLFILNL